MNQQDPAADTEPWSARPPRTAFVTGATGFLGLNLVGQLGEAGWEVVALHRPQSDLKYLQRFPVRRAVAALRIRMPEPSNLLEGAHRQQPVKMLLHLPRHLPACHQHPEFHVDREGVLRQVS